MTDPTVIARAEAALLGSILLQPQTLPQIPWLRSTDFADPWHARVFDVLRQHRDEQITPARVGQWLLATHPPVLADLPRVHTLLQTTPLRPDPVAYARMVLDAVTRRETPAYGVLLRAGALQAALTGTSHPMLAAAALVQHGIAGTRFRWDLAHHPETPRSTRKLLPRLVGTGTGVRDLLLGADRYLTAHGPLDHAGVHAREAELVAALIAHPSTEPPPWLTAPMLTDRGWAATYSALLEMHASGEPVDEVTIAWATARLVAVNGFGPDIRELHEQLEDAATSDPTWCARTVAGDQVRRLADRASTALIQAATNPGLGIPDLLDTVCVHTGALTDLAMAALPIHAEPALIGQVVPLLTRTPPARPAALQRPPVRAI